MAHTLTESQRDAVIAGLAGVGLQTLKRWQNGREVRRPTRERIEMALRAFESLAPGIVAAPIQRPGGEQTEKKAGQ